MTNNFIKLLYATFTLVLFIQCKPSGPEWEATNEALIVEHELAVREISDLPNAPIGSNLKAGQVTNLSKIESTNIHPGVNSTIVWGTGTMVAKTILDPGAEIPEETLDTEGLIFVMEGNIELTVDSNNLSLISRKREEPDGTHSTTPRTDFVYVNSGSTISLQAGDSGATLIEVYSPFRIDYLKKVGVSELPSEIATPNSAEPNIEPSTVYDLYDVQLTKLAEGAYSRLINTKYTQLSFISMEPGSTFPHHIHPEEQMMLLLRGECDEIILDGEQNMKPDDIVVLPGNMVHGAHMSKIGADALDIFWPVRNDYSEKEDAAIEAFRAIIPKDSEVQLVVDGTKTEPQLTFAEGPKWMNGKIYFSNMYFDQNWNADPSKSSIVELNPDGSYKNISEGKMQANGLYPYKNGNLLVCDMIGHRIVEMTTEGRVVKTLVDKYNDKAIDGPNDVVTDKKGGIYFTDPQFTMEPEKSQPGRTVYYRSPEGELTRLVEPNEFAMPNGIILSPDEKTLYINNTYDDESWYPVSSDKDNFIWAYDVNEDGTLSNGRKFAQLFLTENVLEREARSTSADGMAIDKAGNLYVATYYGVQIFNSEGTYIGMINTPHFPVSLCFGGDDMKTLYIVSYSWVYKIETNMEGYVNYL